METPQILFWGPPPPSPWHLGLMPSPALYLLLLLRLCRPFPKEGSRPCSVRAPQTLSADTLLP